MKTSSTNHKRHKLLSAKSDPPKEGSIYMVPSQHVTHDSLGQEAKASLTGIIICAHAMRAPVKSWILGGFRQVPGPGQEAVCTEFPQSPRVQQMM